MYQHLYYVIHFDVFLFGFFFNFIFYFYSYQVDFYFNI